jgi:nitroreductase
MTPDRPTPLGTLDVIRGRRSVRRFEPRAVARETLDALVEALRWAPSAGNLQSRRFYLVLDASLRKKLAHAALGQDFVAEAPVVVVGCADRRIARDYGDRGVELYCLMDVAVSIENLMLLAYERGLGTCWVGAFDEEEASRALGLPAHLRPVALVPLGFPAERPGPPARKRPADVAVVRE